MQSGPSHTTRSVLMPADNRRYVHHEGPSSPLVRATGYESVTKLRNVSGAFQLCTTCGQLAASPCGFRDYREDHCLCESDDFRRTVPLDASLPCVLCMVCGLHVIAGHGRWRLVLCPPCREWSTGLNARVGLAVILPGIHGLVNGGEVIRGVRPPKNLFEAMALNEQRPHHPHRGFRFHEFAQHGVIQRLRLLGFEQGRRIRLEGYLSACAAAGITSDDGKRWIEEHFFGPPA